MIYSIAVCDDSVEYCDIIKEMIQNVALNNNIECNINTYNLGTSLIQSLKENEYDIIFLDMEMPNLNGIETGLRIREISKSPVIFYLTSHKEYAYESYLVKARNYLLKPVNESIIENNLLECIKDNSLKFLDVKDVEGVMHRIPIKEITHILRKKEDRKLHIYTLQEKEVIIVQTLESLKSMLSNNEHFARASKSSIVNMENVRTIIKDTIYFSNNKVEYSSRRCLPVLLNKLKM